MLSDGMTATRFSEALHVKRLPLLGMFDKRFRASYNDARRWTIMTHWMEPEFLEIVRRKGI
jgi:hypothetical protein